MDKKIEKKSNTIWKISAASVLLVVLAYFVFQFMNREKQTTLESQRLTIKDVKYDFFEDMVLFNGTVEPLNTVFINTIESGAVRGVFVEDGSMVERGQQLVELYNPNTELNYLTQETAIIEQINNLSNTRISIKNQQLNLDKNLLEIDHNFKDAQRQYNLDNALYAGKALARNDFEKTEETFRYQKAQQNLIKNRVEEEKVERKAQLTRLNNSIAKMERSLEKLRANKDNFIVRASASGKLSSFSPIVGQSFQGGQSIGKIDLLDGYKIVANPDEYYISDIHTGQEAELTFDNQKYILRVSKVLSEVTNGKFTVELTFQDKTPPAIKRGMSLPLKIYLSDKSQKAFLLPKGGFYQSSGGRFVFVLNENNQAVKRYISIGKSNPYYYEVKEGLQKGDRVITSDYGNYKEMELLNLN